MWMVMGLLAAAGAHSGAPDRAELQQMFALMDRDGNGYVTSSEQPRVPRVTVNGPGRGEIRPGRTWISSYDSDGDGRVSRREFVSRAAAEISAHEGTARSR